MNEHLRDRILRKLDTLSDDRGYQVLDYVEFIESKYAERQSPQANVFTRLTESVEDKLRAGRVSASVIAETMGFLNRASNVLNSAMAAGKSVADDVVRGVSGAAAGGKEPGEPKEGPPAEPTQGSNGGTA
jgi:LmbE family N-acetylglucosaminyl deacetylase